MGLGRKKAKPAFRQMQEIDELERVQNRDVYDRQQLKRSKPEEMQTMTSRTILAACFGLAMMLVCYFVFSVITGFATGFMNSSRGSGNTSLGEQKTVVEEQVETNSDGIRPLSAAPDTATAEDLKQGYLTYHEADIESGNTTPYYTDYDGNIYLEGDVDVLASRVQNHEFMSADDREAASLRQMREQNGVLPLNLAPMNITLDDFYYFYFQDANPESKSMIRRYKDYEGNVYESEEVRFLWQQVQSGQLGSGKVSYLEADGGYSPDSDHLKGKVDADGNAIDGTGSGLLGGFSFRDALRFRGKTFFWSLLIGLAAFGILWEFLKKNLDAQNAENDVTDINQYENDQHIQVPEELQRNYDWFPDAGAHSKVMVSGMISHMMLKKKGLKTVPVVRRAQKDIVGEDGEVAYLKGEPLLDDNGDEITDMLPIIDEKFGNALFEASGALDDPRVRIAYDATKIPYNPGNKNREKQKGFDTVADLINNDWTFPEYEVQRPAGAYIVDVEPINTMVLAITRAGKGQTYIEPTIDMWTRELTPNNMVINDPKGELLVKFYVKGSVRGFQIVQFNLINAMKTDIYNPLMMAAQAAREGDFTKCALYVENIADVFFPTDGAEDPVWPKQHWAFSVNSITQGCV